MRLSCRNYIVVRLGLLQHQDHCVNVILGVAPIALRFQVAESQLIGETELYLGNRMTDLARYEFESASRPFVIEKDAVHAEHIVGFAIIPG